jgi:ParB family chromosome partitioning protein
MSKKKQVGPLVAVQMVTLNLLDEDPNQPRRYFDAEALNELADSIRARGVKTPISVRFNEKTGRYTINHGHRRFRASKLAGKSTIPAYVDNDYIDDDQVIENVHRENLTAREIADYIGRQLAKGKTQTIISQELSKSVSWVSLHAKLLNLPDSIAELFHSGKCTDLYIIHILVVCYKTDPVTTHDWIINNKEQTISRRSAQILKDFIEYNKSKNIELSSEYVIAPTYDYSENLDNEKKVITKPQATENLKDYLDILRLSWTGRYNSENIKDFLDPKEIKLLTNYLNKVHKDGRESINDPIRFARFLSHSEPFNGAGAYQFMAFLLGRDQKDFNFDEIVNNVYSIRAKSV